MNECFQGNLDNTISGRKTLIIGNVSYLFNVRPHLYETSASKIISMHNQYECLSESLKSCIMVHIERAHSRT